MAGPALSSLEERREQLRGSLRELAAERRRLQRRAAGREAREAARERRVEDVGFILLCHESPELGVLRAWLERAPAAGRRVAERVALITERYLAASPDEIAAVTEGASGLGRALEACAARFRVEARLHAWVADMNLAQGVAPCMTRVTQRRWELLDSLSPAQQGQEAAAVVSRSAQYRWLKRFRARWQLRLGVVAAKDQLSLESMREKAGPRSAACGAARSPRGSSWGHPLRRSWGPPC